MGITTLRGSNIPFDLSQKSHVIIQAAQDWPPLAQNAMHLNFDAQRKCMVWRRRNCFMAKHTTIGECDCKYTARIFNIENNSRHM